MLGGGRRAQKLFRERSKLRAKENETRVKELLEELKASEEEIEQQAQRILLLESALALRQPVDIRMSSGRPSSGSPGGSSSVVGVVRGPPPLPFLHDVSFNPPYPPHIPGTKPWFNSFKNVTNVVAPI